VTCGIIVFVAVLVLGYFARELCPRGPIFTSIELDEIRIDRLDDIETGLRKDINTLKVYNINGMQGKGLSISLIEFSNRTSWHFIERKRPKYRPTETLNGVWGSAWSASTARVEKYMERLGMKAIFQSSEFDAKCVDDLVVVFLTCA